MNETTSIQEDLDRYPYCDVGERAAILQRLSADFGLSVLQILGIVEL